MIHSEKNRKYRKFLCFLIVSLILLLSSCGTDHPEKDTAEGEPEQTMLQIGMSFDSFVIERWQRDRDVFVSMAKELGAEVNVQNANGDVEVQKQQLEVDIQQLF